MTAKNSKIILKRKQESCKSMITATQALANYMSPKNDLEMLIQNGIINVKAKLYLKPTSEGGRENGITTGYRPNHVFEQVIDPQMLKSYIGEIEFQEPKIIYPGDDSEVNVSFLMHPSIEQYMQIGQRWSIHEGAKSVGYAEITDIISR